MSHDKWDRSSRISANASIRQGFIDEWDRMNQEEIVESTKQIGNVYDAVSQSGKLLKVEEIDSSQEFSSKRFEQTYEEGGPVLAPLFHVYSVGQTPFDAIYNLAEKKGWKNITNIRFLNDSDDEQVENLKLMWYAKFLVDGTSMKASGWFVPGGAILDSWK